MWTYRAKKNRGFTIVELLIVIVVIAILAAISIVSYNGIQQRARDTSRKNDVAAIAKALHLYNIDNGNYATSGCGNGGGSGWFDYTYGTNTPTVDCLINGGYLSTRLRDPSGLRTCGSGTDCHAYIKMTCSAGTFIYVNLESTPLNSTAADGTCNPTYDSDFGMDYIVKVN